MVKAIGTAIVSFDVVVITIVIVIVKVILVVILVDFQVKVALCGEERAARPIKVEDAREGLDLEFCQIVPGSKDREGRHVSLWRQLLGFFVCFSSYIA